MSAALNTDIDFGVIVDELQMVSAHLMLQEV